MSAILPGETIGILGGGQLGRMLCLEARRMGYRTLVWSGTEVAEPTMGVADEVLCRSFDDQEALARFVDEVAVATVEFENISGSLLEEVEAKVGLYPPAKAVLIAQNRRAEKLFLRDAGVACAPFYLITNEKELAAGMADFLEGAVLKTAAFGYDGKGQVKLSAGMDLGKVWKEFEAEEAMLEKWIPFEKELSVMVARGGDGEMVCYDVAENVHRSHILDTSTVPAMLPEAVQEEAQAMARKIAEALDYRGILGVEFFYGPEMGLLVNEMAPRPHNSGHHTMDACRTSQFEQQLRAVTGLRLGSAELMSEVTMLNLLGDLWRGSEEDLWEVLAKEPEMTWHVYGKSEVRGMRKCGHANFLGKDSLARAREVKRRLGVE